MAKFKIIERNSNPREKDAPKKFYATPITERALSTQQFAKLATTDAAISPGEMLAALDLFGKTALQQLLQGHSVEVPGIGTLRISFSSKGADTPEDFNARTMISGARVLFRPKVEVKQAIANGMYYENAGVRAEGKDYVSLAAYKKAKAEEGDTAAGSGSSSGSNGDDGPTEERP